MKKSRDTLSVNYGIAGNGCYYPMVSHTYWKRACYYDKRCDLIGILAYDAEKMAIATSFRNPTPIEGSEYFMSSERPRPSVNNCEHRKLAHICLPFSVVGIPSSVGDYLTLYGYYRIYPTFSQVDPVHNHPQIDLSAAQRSAWHDMQPEFAGKVSLINFIYELKDFKDMAKFLSNPLEKIRGFRNFVKKQTGRDRKKKGFDPSRPAAELYLTNQFAIQPLIKDITEIMAQLQSMVASLQSEFAEEGTKPNTRYSSTDFVHEDNLTLNTWAQNTGSLYKTKFTAGLIYTYDYKLRSSWDAIATYWGLKLSAEALWNGLPFSFLVDYVFKVGDAIARMEHDTNVSLNIGTYWESLLTSRSVGFHIDGDNSKSPLILDNSEVKGMTLVSGSKATLYTRRVCSPNKGTSLPRLNKPSSRQALNVAALLRVFV